MEDFFLYYITQLKIFISYSIIQLT